MLSKGLIFTLCNEAFWPFPVTHFAVPKPFKNNTPVAVLPVKCYLWSLVALGKILLKIIHMYPELRADPCFFQGGRGQRLRSTIRSVKITFWIMSEKCKWNVSLELKGLFRQSERESESDRTWMDETDFWRYSYTERKWKRRRFLDRLLKDRS